MAEQTAGQTRVYFKCNKCKGEVDVSTFLEGKKANPAMLVRVLLDVLQKGLCGACLRAEKMREAHIGTVTLEKGGLLDRLTSKKGGRS